jgi:hypothetical protein
MVKKKTRTGSRRGSRDADQLLIRLPPGMRAHLAETAERHGRSMNAEVVTALAMYFTEATLGRPDATWDPAKFPVQSEIVTALRAEIEDLTKLVRELLTAWKDRKAK